MNLKDAQRAAVEVQKMIAPFCLKNDQGVPFCRIAGSVRRQKPDMIKDIEFVSIPENRHLRELMDLVNNHWGDPIVGKFPSKYTRIRGSRNLDLFWCTKETFGLNYFIRTGPERFVTRALSVWKKMTNGGYSEGSILHLADGTIVPTIDEDAVFRALQWNFVKPENRM